MTSSDATQLRQEEIAALVPRAGEWLEGRRDGVGLRVGIACARFNGAITTRLLDGALRALEASGVATSDIVVAWVPGAFELPQLALALADGATPCDAVVTLGAVIRGDTAHFDFVAGECARGVQDVQLSLRVPVVFGVLTVDTEAQALERSLADDSNVGFSSAVTAVEMATLLRSGSLAD
jgi:6,7-dimethyl-8-ribityllumazine synthase